MRFVGKHESSWVLGFKDTKWTKAVVNALLFKQCCNWVDYAQVLHTRQFLSPYTLQLAKYVSDQPRQEDVIYPSDYMSQIDHELEPDLVALHKERKWRRLGMKNGHCSASHRKLVFDSLSEAAEKSNGFLTSYPHTEDKEAPPVLHY